MRRSPGVPGSLFVLVAVIAAVAIVIAVLAASKQGSACPPGQSWVQTSDINNVPIFGCE